MPSSSHSLSLLGFIRRLGWNQWMQPLAIGMMMLVVTTNMSTALTQPLPKVKTEVHPEQQHSSAEVRSPRLRQTKGTIYHRWMTEASMTQHSLTAAQFLGRRADNQKSSSETETLTEQG